MLKTKQTKLVLGLSPYIGYAPASNAPFFPSDPQDKDQEPSKEHLSEDIEWGPEATGDFDKDWRQAQEDAYVAILIGNEWLKNGKPAEALKFYSIATSADCAHTSRAILNAWLKYSDIDHALEFSYEYYSDKRTINNINGKLGIVEAWLEHGKLGYAQTFGDMLTESVAAQFKQAVIQEIADLWLSYNNSYAKNMPLTIDGPDNSLVDFLLQKIYVNPAFFTRHNINQAQLEKTFRGILEDLKGDALLASIMRAIAITLKRDSSAKIHLFNKDPLEPAHQGAERQGAYLPAINSVVLIYGNFDDPETRYASIRDTLIHEWTHQLMTMLYRHPKAAVPYPLKDLYRENTYKAAYEEVALAAEKYENPFEAKNLALYRMAREVIGPVKRIYRESSWDAEYIVHLPQAISQGGYRDAEVQRLLQPIKAYWDEYIAPDIEKYLNEHRHLDSFIF